MALDACPAGYTLGVRGRYTVAFRSEQQGNRTRQKKQFDPRIRSRADELHKMGMPYQMAMAVAHGKLDLNVALERMAQKDKVTKLMERHELSRALATQIAIGHADLEQVLSRRRLDAHRAENKERTCLVVGDHVRAFALTGNALFKGKPTEVGPYSAFLLEDGSDEPVEVHKLRFKYSYDLKDWKLVRKGVKKAKKKSDEPVEPAVRPQDRYSCSDRRVFALMDGGEEVVAILLEGEQIRGQISWFSRYELGIRTKGGAEIIVFRHALQNLGTP